MTKNYELCIKVTNTQISVHHENYRQLSILNFENRGIQSEPCPKMYIFLFSKYSNTYS